NCARCPEHCPEALLLQAAQPLAFPRLSRQPPTTVLRASCTLPPAPGLGLSILLLTGDNASTRRRFGADVVAPEVERMAADVRASDGLPRYVWTNPRGRTLPATHR